MPRLQFIKDVASTLVWYAPEGVPDGAATLTIYTGGQGELEGDTWPASVSLTAVTSTTTAEVTQQSESLPVADGSSFVVDERYWVEDNGQRVAVKIRKKDSNTLYIDQPVPFTVESGATVASGKYAYSLSAAQNANLRRRLRAVWSYAVGGVNFSHTQYYSVVREPFSFALSEDDIEAHDHNFGEYAGTRGAWRSLIAGAQGDVERMLRAKQLTPDLIRDRDGLKDAVIFSLLAKFYRAIPGQVDRSQDWRTEATRAIEEVSEARTWYDADDDHAVTVNGQTRTYDADGNPIILSGDAESASLLGSKDELSTPARYMKVG